MTNERTWIAISAVALLVGGVAYWKLSTPACCESGKAHAAAPAEAAAVGETLARAKLGKQAPDFELKDENGKSYTLKQFRGKIVVLEWTSPGCPFVKRHYEARTMKTTAEALPADKVVWLAIDSSKQATSERTKEWRAKYGFTYPSLLDPSGKVGKLYGAKTTPHMFVVDKDGMLRYEGAIDNDIWGREKAPRNYVRDAVGALTSGKPVDPAQTEPYGCSVKYAGE